MVTAFGSAVIVLGIAWGASAGAEERLSIGTEEMIEAAKELRGGLVVHLGCGTGQRTADLAAGGRNVVHGLSADSTEVAAARDLLRQRGLYGPVSVMRCRAVSLPYVDHLVNLLIVEEPDQVQQDEWLRVLVPGGTAYVKDGDGWTKVVKPMRQGADEWTHYLYDASGNPVSQDRLVGPPRHLQWSAGPTHTRSHEYTSSVAAVVSSGGRIFYLVDEGPTGNLQGAADWNVMARDAHNGLLLWKRPIDQWYTHLAGWTSVPIQLQRRLVAADGRVYVTLGYHAAVSALDARTGEILRVYDETEGADEILWQDGVLIVAAKTATDQELAKYKQLQDAARRRGGPLHARETGQPLIQSFKQAENRAGRFLVALDADTGTLLWKRTGADAAGLKPLSLQACENRVFFHRKGTLVCLDLRTGQTLWSQRMEPPRAASSYALVCWNKQAVTCLRPEDGRVRWTQKTDLVSVRDVFVTQDSVWIGGFQPYDTGTKYTGPAWGPYFAVQRNLETGEIVKQIAAENPGHHHRCYVSKATERYILGGRRGTEFLDLQSGEHLWNSWARGVCRYGVMPANGLLYVPPHSCGCYITAKLTGFNALAAARVPLAANSVLDPPPLEKGTAYGRSGAATHPEDWPTYRGNPGRSGVASCAVSSDLRVKWQVAIGARLAPPSVANGKVFVASIDEHRLVALDTDSGKIGWDYVTDARVDSPPTIHDGFAMLGCRDGCVYRLHVEDGSLAWRFRAARGMQRIASSGQLESVWPIHGSILVDEDVAYFTAGRSSYLDGGLDLFRLEPSTGHVLSVHNVYSPDPETGRQPDQFDQNRMPGSRSDILVADGDHIYFRDLPFSKNGQPLERRVPHLFTLTDFLDDSWTHRSYWVFAAESSIATGCSGRDRNLIYGRLLLYDDATIYGYARENVHWSNAFQDAPYRLYARERNANSMKWTKSVPVQVQAMLRAEKRSLSLARTPIPSRAPNRRPGNRALCCWRTLP